MTSQLDTVIDCANIAMNCDHTADPVGMVCWTCAMKMVSIAETAEADNASLRGTLRDEILRAEAAEARDAQLEAERDLANAHAARLMQERDEALTKLEQAVAAERDRQKSLSVDFMNELPTLWGDHVRDGKITITIDAELVYRIENL